MPPVAGLFQAVQHITHGEVAWFGRFQLLPGQGMDTGAPGTPRGE